MTGAEQTGAGELIELLETVRLDAEFDWGTVLRPLARVLRSEIPFIYGVRLGEQWPECDGAWAQGLDVDRGRYFINAAFRRSGGFGLYSPALVSRDQRNRALTLTELVPEPRRSLQQWGFDQFGLGRHDQLRVLVCERAVMRLWVGGFRPDDEPYGAREVRRLQRLVPSLRRRLMLQDELRTAALTAKGLNAALSALGRAAVLVDGKGRVVCGNRPALELRARAPREFSAEVLDAMRGRSPRWVVHRVRAPGLPAHALLIHAPTRGAWNGIAAARRWGLSPREAQVLAALREGLNNASIAARLVCADRTVEAHVSKLLEKSGCETRAELVATLWRTTD